MVVHTRRRAKIGMASPLRYGFPFAALPDLSSHCLTDRAFRRAEVLALGCTHGIISCLDAHVGELLFSPPDWLALLFILDFQDIAYIPGIKSCGYS